jgi:hypothetical protein
MDPQSLSVKRMQSPPSAVLTLGMRAAKDCAQCTAGTGCRIRPSAVLALRMKQRKIHSGHRRSVRSIRAGRFAIVKERDKGFCQRVLQWGIAQLDFEYGCIGDGFTVFIGEADAVGTIGVVALGIWSSKDSQPALANVGPPPGGEIGTVNDTAGITDRVFQPISARGSTRIEAPQCHRMGILEGGTRECY